ncbi:hypothetical protein Q7P35_007031 [Cladosporium inversicolor]
MTGEGAEYQLRVWPGKLSVCATTRPLRARGSFERHARHALPAPKTGNKLLYRSVFGSQYERGHGVGESAVLATQARRMMTGYVYEAGGDMLIFVVPSEDISSDRCGWFGSVSIGSLQGPIRSHAANRLQTPRLDHAALTCASRWTDHHRPLYSPDSASGSQKATLRLTNEPLEGWSHPSPRHLMPSIRRTALEPTLYDISQRSETRASPYNTFTSARRSPRTSEST